MKPAKSQSLINVLEQGKDTYFKNQMKTIFEYLKENTATASMIENETGIVQKNICRYKRTLEKAGLLFEIEKKVCKKTGFKAYYLSTNPEHKPKSKQFLLFEND